MKNILLFSPIFDNNKLSLWRSEVGVYEGLKDLGYQVFVIDYKSKLQIDYKGNVSQIELEIPKSLPYPDLTLCMGAGLSREILKSNTWTKIRQVSKTVLWNSECVGLPQYFNRLKDQVRIFDYFFHFDQSEIPIYKSLGIDNVSVLRQAANPKWYYPIKDWNPEYPMCFVGSIGGDKWCNREYFLKTIQNHFKHKKINVVSGVWDANKVNTIYNMHKIVLNIGLFLPNLGPMSYLKAGDYNQKCFEAIMSGGCLLTNELPNSCDKLFEDRKNILYFNKENLIEQIEYGIERYKEIRENIQKIMSEHTYKHRVGKMLEILKYKNII